MATPSRLPQYAVEGDTGTTLDGPVLVHRVRTSMQRLPWLYSDLGRTHAPPMADPEISMAVGRLLADGRFDLVHAHDWIVNSAFGPARRARTPVVLTQHDYSHVCATKLMMRNGEVCPGPSPSPAPAVPPPTTGRSWDRVWRR